MVNIDERDLRRFSLTKRIAAVVFVLIFAIVVGLIWWNVAQAPINPLDKSSKTFIITPGDGVREIAKKLHDQGLIRDQVAFFILVKKLGIEKNIQAGTYSLSPSLTAEQLARKLTVGKDAETKITIPEGWRTEQILDYLKSQGFVPESSLVLLPQGQYFPDTYFVAKKDTVSQILGLMNDNYKKQVNFPVTSDQLIVASMIEREAKRPEDRPLIASVIYNRLHSGMSLDIDATVQYAIGYTAKDGWWKKDLTLDDLKFKSPYNTYINAGLPPTPICNPGLSAIHAAVTPAQTDYLYYMHDKSGNGHFAKTLPEHNANVAKYL